MENTNPQKVASASSVWQSVPASRNASGMTTRQAILRIAITAGVSLLAFLSIAIVTFLVYWQMGSTACIVNLPKANQLVDDAGVPMCTGIESAIQFSAAVGAAWVGSALALMAFLAADTLKEWFSVLFPNLRKDAL